MKRAIVTGSSGFIGQHLVRRLKDEGYHVTGFDIKNYEYGRDACDRRLITDLRHVIFNEEADEVYALAADMGGAGFVFSGENDADILTNSARINLNTAEACRRIKVGKVFFASSACVYPDLSMPCQEKHVEKGQPDSPYGLEKLFSECLYLSYARNYGLNVRIGRFFNVFGPYGTWQGGREKAPAAICRKVAQAEDGGTVEIWGDGKQTRSFLYIDEAIEGVRRLMESDFAGPVNIGSEESISIASLAGVVGRIADKGLQFRYVPGPTGVQGRNSDNTLIRERLEWAPSAPLEEGLRKTYAWIAEQVRLAAEK